MFRIGEALGTDPDELDLWAWKFQEWADYFNWQDTRRDKLDFYLAQIAGYASQKPRWKLSEFMVHRGGRKLLTADELAKIARSMYGKPKSISER